MEQKWHLVFKYGKDIVNGPPIDKTVADELARTQNQIYGTGTHLVATMEELERMKSGKMQGPLSMHGNHGFSNEPSKRILDDELVDRAKKSIHLPKIQKTLEQMRDLLPSGQPPSIKNTK